MLYPTHPRVGESLPHHSDFFKCSTVRRIDPCPAGTYNRTIGNTHLNDAEKIVMGIDPGLRHTGFAIVRQAGRKLAPVEYDLIKTPSEQTLPQRLETIFEVISGVIERHQPEAVAIEELFFGKNSASAIDVGHARGVMIVAARLKGVQVFEYTGLEVKMALTGYGRADKGQVAYMVRQVLKMKEDPKPRDVTDALAIALCHLQTKDFSK